MAYADALPTELPPHAGVPPALAHRSVREAVGSERDSLLVTMVLQVPCHSRTA
jgi:hypothetical protein